MRDPAACSGKTFPHGHATSRTPARRIPGSVPAAPTRDRTVGRCRGLRAPNLGENREEFELGFGGVREDGCLQRRPAAPAVFSIKLPTGRPGTVPAARSRTASLLQCRIVDRGFRYRRRRSRSDPPLRADNLPRAGGRYPSITGRPRQAGPRRSIPRRRGARCRRAGLRAARPAGRAASRLRFPP